MNNAALNRVIIHLFFLHGGLWQSLEITTIYRTACSVFQGAVNTHDIEVVDIHYETECSCYLLQLTFEKESLFAILSLFIGFILKYPQCLLIN
jgi:hypothetical protein